MPNAHRFPQLLVTHVLAYQLLPAQKQCLPSPLLSFFWMSQQCHHIAQETKLVMSFHLPPEIASHVSHVSHLRGTFPKALLPVPSGRTPLWSKSQSQTSGGQHCAVDESRKGKTAFDFSHQDLEAAYVWFWKQTYHVPLLYSQDKTDPGIMLGNQPCLLAISLSLPSVSSTVLIAVHALSHPPKEPWGHNI